MTVFWTYDYWFPWKKCNCKQYFLFLRLNSPFYWMTLPYIYISKVGDRSWGRPEGSFSIVTTPKYRERHYSLFGLLHFTLDMFLILLNVKQWGIKYHFLSLWYDFDQGLNPGHWRTLYYYIYIYIYIYIELLMLSKIQKKKFRLFFNKKIFC